jgi:hypothetical protein
MTDWIEHYGGPQPVDDKTYVHFAWRGYDWSAPNRTPACNLDWSKTGSFHILNQHLIDAARLEGIRLGLEAAAREGANWFGSLSHDAQEILANIRTLDPATIAKETAR